MNAKCKNGETPLMNAASIGNVQIIELPLKKGADVNSFDSLGKHALYHAAFRGKNMQFIRNEGSYVNAALEGAVEHEYVCEASP